MNPASAGFFVLAVRSFAMECECGNPKRPYAEGCDRCTFLDRGTATSNDASDLIAAMRDGAQSYTELCAATGRSLRSTMRAMQRLLELGRVRRWEAEGEGTYKRVHAAYGKGVAREYELENGRVFWRYALSAR